MQFMRKPFSYLIIKNQNKMNLQKAKKQQVKLRIGISSPSGFGKTYSSLLLAYGITNDWSKIAMIDTENGSGSLYSGLGEYNILNLEAPYTPERYIEAMKVCENASMEVIVVDSLSHEWSGKGGCLQIHEQLGGRFQDWSRVSPRHQAFIDAIQQSKCHVITTVRKKIDYSMDRDSNGRTKVVKLGLKDVTREGLDYEWTLSFEIINKNHLVVASKDRTGLFVNSPEFKISSNTGKKIKAWCGEIHWRSREEIQSEIEQCTGIEGLRHVYAKYPDRQEELKPLIMERKKILETVSSCSDPKLNIKTNLSH